MRRIFSKILIATIVAATVSCEDRFLDRAPDDQIDEQQVFKRYTRTNQLVTDLYANVKGANKPLVFFNHFSSAAVTDEAEGTAIEGGLTFKFNSGDWGPNGMPAGSSTGQYWWDLYAKIRRANVILEGIRQYQTPDNPLRPGELGQRIGETYFMRAYLHFLAARMYGEIVYMNATSQLQDTYDFQKESFHTTVEKIIADCDSALERVPAAWGGADFGRIDRGACLGLKAMTLWMAATPLWNGGTLPGDTRQFKDEYGYDVSRWEAAKIAAKAVIDLEVNGSPRYRLYTGHSENDFADDAGDNNNNSKVHARLWDMYYSMDAYQQEAIFFVTKDKNDAWQGDIYPPSYGGSSRQQPVQEQVDEYEYIAPDGYGYPVYHSKAKRDGYDDQNPYESVQRDPRFYRDVTYHGAAFRGEVINTADGADKIGATNATTTGYYHRKFLRESWNRDRSFDINGPPIWRLPEIIYIYCEAVNESEGPNEEIYDMINQIRERSFMAPMPQRVSTNKALMNEYIQRERRVELQYENNRIWSFRLYLEPNSETALAREKAWQAAGSSPSLRSQKYWPYPKTQRMINGMRPIESPNGKIEVNGKKYIMERYFVKSRVFVAPRHYLFPIQQDELQRTPSLVQNPGW